MSRPEQDGAAVEVTDAMVEAAAEAWWKEKDTSVQWADLSSERYQDQVRLNMRAALAAALALPEQDGEEQDREALIVDAALAIDKSMGVRYGDDAPEELRPEAEAAVDAVLAALGRATPSRAASCEDNGS